MLAAGKHLWLLLGLLALSLTSCSQQKPITNGPWSFDERKGRLKCNEEEVPAVLAKQNLSLFTPLGTFTPRPDGTWFRQSFKVPLPNPSQRWVSMQLQSGPAGFEPAHANAGYYSTHTLGYGSSSWLDMQLTDTPASWIYAFRVRDGTESGAWIAPDKLGAVDWEAILKAKQTARLNLETKR